MLPLVVGTGSTRPNNCFNHSSNTLLMTANPHASLLFHCGQGDPLKDLLRTIVKGTALTERVHELKAQHDPCTIILHGTPIFINL